MSNSNKRIVAGTPTSSGHFHPRLSMRAAVSNTITEDALNLIQQQQNQSLSPRGQSPELQSQDLMDNLTKFVGPDGLIKEPFDLNGYAELMQYENSPSRQILLLKIIVATLEKNPSISEKLVDSEGLMVILGLWLSSIDQDKLLESVLVGKILEILSKLTFTVDLLVKYKFGRVIKKITQQKGKLSKNATISFDLATKLFDDWSNLANKSEIPTVPRRKSDENVQKVEEQPKEQVPTIDTIQSSKRSSEFIETKETGQDYDNVDEVKRTKIAQKKSVKFPDSFEKLCQVFIFERAPEEYEYLSDGSAARDSYLHADKGEASMAFEQIKGMDVYDEPLFNFKPWKPLEKLEGIPEERPEGIESEEKIIQRQRERSVLSVTYYSESEIPPSPSEVDVDYLTDDRETVKVIPIRSNETIVKQSVSIKMPSLIVPQMFSPELFNNFSGIYNNNLLNPFVTAPSVTYETEPVYVVKKTSNSYMDDSFTRRSSHKGFEYQSTSPSLSSTSSSSSRSSSRDDRGRDSYYSSRGLCRHYRPGKPKSCWLGSDCKFIHQD